MSDFRENKENAWQAVQEKAFTAWMNETLGKSGSDVKITDLRHDLADGQTLAHFFQHLSNKKIQTKVETRPVTRIQKIQNLHIALTFLEAEMSVRNPGCSAEDIADAVDSPSKVKLILGLLWMVYRKFRIATIHEQDKSSEEGLLLWVKHVTQGYEEVNIESFKSSFKDGMAFLAMVHRFNPEKTKVNLKNHSKDTPESNLSMAFELAEQELGIPRLLDTREVLEGRVDERSLVLYTSLFFHAFKAAAVTHGLEQEKLSTEEALTREKQKNEELREQHNLLLSEFETLKVQFQELSRQKLQLSEQFEEERNEITLTLHQKEESTLKLKHQVEEKQEETLKLRQVLEEERSETNVRLDEYQKKNLELSEQLHEEQTRRLELESKVTDLSSSLNESQETNLHIITDLRKKQGLYEEEIESLKNDVENFKAQLDNERKENTTHHQALQERTEQDTFHRKGLQVLHKNLDEHIADLHTWQKYLDSKDRHWLDFEQDVRPSLNSELSSQADFIEELNLLSDKLEQENEAMIAILKVKMAEAKSAQIESKETKGK